MIKYKQRSLPLCFGLILFSLSACQKHEDAQKTTEHKSAKAESQASNVAEIPAFPEDCNSVDTAISSLEKTYSPEGLNTLNQLFKKCLADVPLETRYQWQEKSTEIYQHLLSESSPEVYQYMTATVGDRESMSAKQKKELYKKLKPKAQYLVDHAKALYLEKFYVGEGEYTFVQHPQYDLDIFAPYLEKSDQIYFKQIRQEYLGENYILDAGLSISFDEVADRLLFWENFKKTYPNNHYKTKVDEYIKQYGAALFKGDDNTRTLWFDEDKIADPEAMRAIKKVSISHSSSSPIAQKFEQLIQSNKQLWEQLPKTSGIDADYDSPEQQDIRNQRDALENKIKKNVDELLKPFDN